jgi:SnoaL-like domain
MIIVGLEMTRQEKTMAARESVGPARESVGPASESVGAGEAATAREQIAQACSSYALGLDRRELGLYLEAWHPDAWCARADRVFREREQLIEWAEDVWSRYRWTSHLVGNLRVSDVSEGRARCVSATQAMLVRLDGELLLAGAHYEDVFAFRDGVWRIAERTMVAGSFARVPGAAITVGWGGAAVGSEGHE